MSPLRRMLKGRKMEKEQVGFLVHVLNILKFDKYPFKISNVSKARKLSNSIFPLFFFPKDVQVLG